MWARIRTRDDLGVSPVIGIIMILAISVTGIAATIAWGLPAIDEMKSAVEARAVANQFKELEQDVKQLVSGTAEKTAKRWQPSLARGSVNVVAGTERWVVGYASCLGGGSVECNDQIAGVLQEYSFTFAGLGDTDDQFTLVNNGTTAISAIVRGETIDNGAASALQVGTLAAGCAVQMDTGTVINPGSSQVFRVCTSGGAQRNIQTSHSSLPGAVFHFTVEHDLATDVIAAEVWVYDAGEVSYTLDSTGSRKTVDLTNTAVIIGTGGHEVLDNTPGIPALKETATGWAFFARGVGFQGSTSFAGEDRFDILISLYGTNSLANEAEVSEVYLQTAGDHRDVWDAYFSSQNGYNFQPDPDAGADVNAWTQQVKDGTDWQAIEFTFVHSVVSLQA